MKTAIAIVLAVALTGAVGCRMSPRGGNLSRKDETFRIVVPLMSSKVKQGLTENVELKLDRGSFFREDVKLEVSPVKGITIEPNSVTVKAGDPPEIPLKISAAPDAPLGKCTIFVTATPKTGAAAKTSFVLKVVEP